MKKLKKILPAAIIIICVIIPELFLFSRYGSDFHEICPGAAFCAAPLCIKNGYFIFKTGIIIFAVILILTLFFRRFFCGWICPLGLFQDLIFKIRRYIRDPFKQLPSNIHKALLLFKYLIILVFLILIFYTGKMLTVIYCPVYLTSTLGVIPPAVPAVILLGIIILTGIFINRCFCRYLCPLSVLFEFTLFAGEKLKISRPIRFDKEECKYCKICEKNCPVGIKITSDRIAVSTNCIACYKCMKICPQNKKNKNTLYIGKK